MKLLDIQRAFSQVVGGSASNLATWLRNLSQGGSSSSSTLVCNVTLDHQEGDDLVYCLNVDYDELVATPVSNITIVSEYDDAGYLVTSECSVSLKEIGDSLLHLSFALGGADETIKGIDRGSDNKAYFTIAGGK